MKKFLIVLIVVIGLFSGTQVVKAENLGTFRKAEIAKLTEAEPTHALLNLDGVKKVLLFSWGGAIMVNDERLPKREFIVISGEKKISETVITRIARDTLVRIFYLDK